MLYEDCPILAFHRVNRIAVDILFCYPDAAERLAARLTQGALERAQAHRVCLEPTLLCRPGTLAQAIQDAIDPPVCRQATLHGACLDRFATCARASSSCGMIDTSTCGAAWCIGQAVSRLTSIRAYSLSAPRFSAGHCVPLEQNSLNSPTRVPSMCGEPWSVSVRRSLQESSLCYCSRPLRVSSSEWELSR